MLSDDCFQMARTGKERRLEKRTDCGEIKRLRSNLEVIKINIALMP